MISRLGTAPAEETTGLPLMLSFGFECADETVKRGLVGIVICFPGAEVGDEVSRICLGNAQDGHRVERATLRLVEGFCFQAAFWSKD